MQMLEVKPEEAESKESFKNTQRRTGEDIENEMAAEKNPRKRGQQGPQPNHQIEKVSVVVGEEVSDRGDEEDARGVAAREGVVVDGNGGDHVLVVEGTGSAEEELDEGDEKEVEEEAEEEGGEEGAAEEEKGGGRIGGEEEGEGDWEEEAEVGGEFEEEEEEVWEEGFHCGVEVFREGCVYAY
ncbi:hypothetical protein CMV_006284 [Castanea mollissima]|uniref:Uncharacterized protein n=1 Tax=Castanea mollissima TaxID=60419 RepID=A0A8J4VRD2_9ROSI|nr:hypothetical protein CMV_006284 [Castanea mollissima]